MRRMTPLLIVLLALVPALVRADGFIVIHPPSQPIAVPRGHFSFAPLEVTYHRVDVEVNDQVAVTSVDQEFYNPNHQQLEGTYLFPLPAGAHIDKFSMDVNGTMQEAELLPADKARAIYEDIVRRSKDPALLEYMGRDAFRVRIFPIEPHKGKKVKISYTQLLKSDTGLTEYTYPLNTEKFSARPLKEVALTVTLACNQPIKSVYSPSHKVEIKRDGDKRAVIGFEEKNVRPDTDFKLIFSKNANPVGIDLLTYRVSGDDGYFLLMATPSSDAKAAVQPKDVCLVFDTSGSMAGKKMDQAKKAVAFCLANLNEQDRFEIVRFSTEAEPFFDELKPANKENVDKAQQFVASLKPIGGTAIADALGKAMAQGAKRSDPDKRPYVVIFLTDGLPTIGETSQEKILAAAKDGAKGAQSANTRIFSFGIGTDVNTHLLDRLAEDTRAVSQYVLPEEDIEVKLSNFYTKIKEPVLSNLAVAFTGDVRVTQLYPNAMPDLFKGDSLMVFGRYTGKGGASAAKITGTLSGEKKEFVTDVTFTESDTKNTFIPRLWATRRVGWLLDEIRLRGETKETKDEVVRLAREHGIVTPYTAYLILEDEQRRGVPVAMQNMRELGADRDALATARERLDGVRAEAATPDRRTGKGAVDTARSVSGLKTGTHEMAAAPKEDMAKRAYAGGGAGGAAAAKPDASGRPGDPSSTLAVRGTKVSADAEGELGYRAEKSQNYAEQARIVNGRAFYQNENVWNDSTAQSKKDLKTVQVKFGTDEYFDLLKKHPEAAQWLALGDNVDVVIGETLYQVRGG
ncbi:MAG: VIT domain-containing protein [Phycisphaerae bacterium]|nr:VIT domain-containing protein [Tepidisphaeraceae bacterium]